MSTTALALLIHNKQSTTVSMNEYPVYARHVDSSVLVFSLLSHQHSEIVFIFTSRLVDS
jgi:hypothetical protein